MKIGITKELIFDHFANKVTPLQRKQIEVWLEERGNEELYYKWLEEWENNNLEYQPESDALVAGYWEFLRANPEPLEEAEEPSPAGRHRMG